MLNRVSRQIFRSRCKKTRDCLDLLKSSIFSNFFFLRGVRNTQLRGRNSISLVRISLRNFSHRPFFFFFFFFFGHSERDWPFSKALLSLKWKTTLLKKEETHFRWIFTPYRGMLTKNVRSITIVIPTRPVFFFILTLISSTALMLNKYPEDQRTDFSQTIFFLLLVTPSLFLHLRQLVNGCCKGKVFGEELDGMRIHQFVRLPDRYVRHAGDVANLFLRSLVLRSLHQISSFQIYVQFDVSPRMKSSKNLNNAFRS